MATSVVNEQRPSWWMIIRTPEELNVAEKSRTQGGQEITANGDQPAQEMKKPTLVDCLVHASVLGPVLACLTFSEWSVLSSVNRELLLSLQRSDELREEVLERYLSTVGYRRWSLPTPDPLFLSLKVPIT
jgi:hypothetical protein